MKQEVSAKRAAANRANAAKSTGPRTPEGKARSAQNARKHGLLATALSVIRLEDQDELRNLTADAVADYRPQTAQEMYAVERIAVCQLAMLRSYRLEAGMFTATLNITLNVDNSSPVFPLHQELVQDRFERVEQNRNYALAEGFHTMNKETPSWSL